MSFACEEGSFYLPQIEEYIGRKLECIVPDEDLLVPAPKGVKAEGQPEVRREGPKKRRRPGSGSRDAERRRR